MSSITIVPSPSFGASHGVARPRRATGGASAALRLTRRGRAVLVTAFFALLAVLMIVFGGLAGASFDAGTPEQVRIVQVGQGDTLYGIAGEIAEPGQIRETVAHIQKLNGLTGAGLQIGQQLAVPVR